MRDYDMGTPSRGCLLAAGLSCFFWAAVLIGASLWFGWF